jgi:hypothetical protein
MKKIKLSPQLKKVARSGRRAADKIAKAAKLAKKKFEQAEKSGSLEIWRSRVGLGVQALQVAGIATAAIKGISVGKKRAPVRRARRTAKRAKR